MSFAASVLRVMIASPSDIPDARDAVEAAINDWNNANATNKQVVLLPWRWETSSVPVLSNCQDLWIGVSRDVLLTS